MHGKIRAAALFAAVMLAGCASNGRAPTQVALERGEAEPAPGGRILTFEQAEKLAIDPGFEVLRLARTVPQRGEYLSAVKFRLRDSRDDSTRPTLMRNSQMHNALQFTTHVSLRKDDDPVDESSVSLFGVASVAYRAWFSVGPLSELSDVYMKDGKLFSVDSDFVLVTTRGGQTEYVVSCRVAARMPASKLNPKLHGDATAFDCTTLMDRDKLPPLKNRIVYLDAYTQYLPLANPNDDSDDASGWTSFEIADVVVTPR